jgi:hypothetical protein
MLHSSDTGVKKRGHNETVHQLYVDLDKTCNSISREVLYNTLFEIGTHMNVAWLIKVGWR